MLKSRGIPVVCEAVDLDGEHRGGKCDVDQVVALRQVRHPPGNTCCVEDLGREPFGRRSSPTPPIEPTR